MKMESAKNVKHRDAKQIDINFDQPKPIEKVELKDSKGRNHSDIVKQSRSLSEKILDTIIFKDSEWYIENQLADEWIKEMNELDEPGEYVRGQR